ncbi:MAG TPA: 4-hydroxyphenylpyruvate dioxygenase [Gammaproteobacteria bacterium]|nr:4-hydroxyphenylpyruvate dioxygenase [Gammaproteobacteria bacterium]
MSAEPVQVSGLSFVEFSGPRPELLTDLFERMGLEQVGGDSARNIALYAQNDIRFLSNPGNGGNAERFRKTHQRGASAMGFRVENGEQALAQAIRLGAEPAELTDYPIPAIKGVGKSLIYLVDAEAEKRLFTELGWSLMNGRSVPDGDLLRIDHLTHNLDIGGIDRLRRFYERVFGFEVLRTFDIEGRKTGLFSLVVANRDRSVIIPLNETKDDKSQIAEFLREYNGEGIQHIALATRGLCRTVDALTARGIEFQDTLDTYYEAIDERVPNHGEDVEALRQRRILIDGGDGPDQGFLLQIFTRNSIGPIFFEYIQRKGHDGFGEGNFQALFDSIELDQMRRGVL